MANIVWIFAFLCIQFSGGERVVETDNVSDGAVADAAVSTEVSGKKVSSSEWTEEDQKWLDEIQSLLAGDSDEDYDIDFDKTGEVIDTIEKLMKEHDPENGDYKWFEMILEWILDDDYDNDDSKSNESDEFYSWLHGKGDVKPERPLKKRFSSL